MVTGRRLFARGSWSDTRHFVEILRQETVGGVLLLIAATAALVWANSSWSHSYHAFAAFTVGPAALHLNLSLAGWAAGAGLSLALAADFSVGGPDTRLLAAYPGIGLSPDGGMSWRLPRAIGHSAARAFIIGNEPMSGERAYALGMLTGGFVLALVRGWVRGARASEA